MKLKLVRVTSSALSKTIVAISAAAVIVASPRHAQAEEAVPKITRDAGLASMVPKAFRDKGSLTVGVNPDVAPIKFVDEDGAIVGFTPDLFAAAATMLGLKVEFAKVSFDALLPGMVANRFDALLSLSDFKSRQRAVTFVDYLDMGETVVAKPGHMIAMKSSADLCGLQVAIARGTAAMQSALKLTESCKDSGKKPLVISTYPDGNMTLLSVTTGSADVAWIDSPIGYYNQAKFPQKYAVVFFTPVSPYGIGFGPDDNGKQLAVAFQQALLKLEKTGVYNMLIKRWGLSAKDGKPTFPINGGEL
jgi:polar amino acid transport system substrate-binding protein